MIQAERIQRLNSLADQPGEAVVYWMQQDQRVGCNHALAFAIAKADELRKPLLVRFRLERRFPGATRRHFDFMRPGLEEVRRELGELGIGFQILDGVPMAAVASGHPNPCCIICDHGPLRIQRQWRRELAVAASCAVYEVETGTVVPTALASGKAEFAAATLRPKLHRLLPGFLRPLELRPPRLRFPEIDSGLPEGLGRDLPDPFPSAELMLGGRAEGLRRLRQFLDAGLGTYDEASSDPVADAGSKLSPYLHFGQLSPLEIALAVQAVQGIRPEAKEAFLEQLIVRRELSWNFVLHTPGYDRYDEAVPEWARQTLVEHQADRRPYLYSATELENAATHDPYWNAAQNQMRRTGHMHNYLRMYWGKKVLEWSPTPQEAFATLLALNDRYELDGRDPNGFASIAWCFGRHDRGWPERAIFGKVRYMNAAGLERKFDIRTYAARWQAAAGDAGRQ